MHCVRQSKCHDKAIIMLCVFNAGDLVMVNVDVMDFNRSVYSYTPTSAPQPLCLQINLSPIATTVQ